MALEATHIRFALDVKDEYNISSLEKYLSGTIYPDSRYITCSDRDLTHSDGLLSLDFAKDDFRKGWYIHLVCDKVQAIVKEESRVSSSNKTDDWVLSTAIKNIQDIKDVQCFDI